MRLLLLCSFVPTLALADEAEDVVVRVHNEVVKPLSGSTRKVAKFSRVARPPASYSARLLQKAPSTDAEGRAFYAFAIDQKRWDAFEEEDEAPKKKETKPVYTGCAYVDGAVYVKQGEAFRPAAILAGKRVAPVENVCVARELANVL